MIEVGKCYKVQHDVHCEYFKITSVSSKEQWINIAKIELIDTGTLAKICKNEFTDSSELEHATEIPESEYKAKLAEVKQILEEMG